MTRKKERQIYRWYDLFLIKNKEIQWSFVEWRQQHEEVLSFVCEWLGEDK